MFAGFKHIHLIQHVLPGAVFTSDFTDEVRFFYIVFSFRAVAQKKAWELKLNLGVILGGD